MSQKMDQYLDTINQLESSNKSIATIQRLNEQYKDKSVELEREKFEAVSSLQLKDIEYQSIKDELEYVIKQRNNYEDELGLYE